MQITNNLLVKIHHDLVWWKNPTQGPFPDLNEVKNTKNDDFKDENQNWDKKGLDHKALE